MKVKIEFYVLPDGTAPVQEYLDSLDPKKKAKAARVINQLSDLGTELRMPNSEALSGGIFQMRTHFRNDQIRILYFFLVDYKVVLTNAFTKKTRKTPKKEIELAIKRRDDYIRRFCK